MTLRYKGYVGKVEVDPKADLLHGEVLGIRDVVTFQGRSPRQIQKAFRESVDDYLEFCEVRGEAPDKPFSGKFIVRMDPKLHRAASILAQAANMSLNSWVNSKLSEDVEKLLKGSSGSPSRRWHRSKPRRV